VFWDLMIENSMINAGRRIRILVPLLGELQTEFPTLALKSIESKLIFLVMWKEKIIYMVVIEIMIKMKEDGTGNFEKYKRLVKMKSNSVI